MKYMYSTVYTAVLLKLFTSCPYKLLHCILVTAAGKLRYMKFSLVIVKLSQKASN